MTNQNTICLGSLRFLVWQVMKCDFVFLLSVDHDEEQRADAAGV